MNAPTGATAISVPHKRFLPLNFIAGLGAVALAEAAVVYWAVSAPDGWLPLSGVISPAILPALIASMAICVALLVAPFFFTASVEFTDRAEILGRALFMALWQSACASYLLLITSRIVPLDAYPIMQAAGLIGLLALAACLLAQAAPKYYAAIMFGWVVALPVFAYLFAEVILGSTGHWRDLSTPHAGTVRALMHWLLLLSPGTSVYGAITGILPDGSEFQALPACGVQAVVCAILALNTGVRKSAPGLPAADAGMSKNSMPNEAISA